MSLRRSEQGILALARTAAAAARDLRGLAAGHGVVRWDAPAGGDGCGASGPMQPAPSDLEGRALGRRVSLKSVMAMFQPGSTLPAFPREAEDTLLGHPSL